MSSFASALQATMGVAQVISNLENEKFRNELARLQFENQQRILPLEEELLRSRIQQSQLNVEAQRFDLASAQEEAPLRRRQMETQARRQEVGLESDNLALDQARFAFQLAQNEASTRTRQLEAQTRFAELQAQGLEQSLLAEELGRRDERIQVLGAAGALMDERFDQNTFLNMNAAQRTAALTDLANQTMDALGVDPKVRDQYRTEYMSMIANHLVQADAEANQLRTRTEQLQQNLRLQQEQFALKRFAELSSFYTPEGFPVLEVLAEQGDPLAQSFVARGRPEPVQDPISPVEQSLVQLRLAQIAEIRNRMTNSGFKFTQEQDRAWRTMERRVRSAENRLKSAQEDYRALTSPFSKATDAEKRAAANRLREAEREIEVAEGNVNEFFREIQERQQQHVEVAEPVASGRVPEGSRPVGRHEEDGRLLYQSPDGRFFDEDGNEIPVEDAT